jgi:hypothetical protein
LLRNARRRIHNINDLEKLIEGAEHPILILICHKKRQVTYLLLLVPVDRSAFVSSA